MAAVAWVVSTAYIATMLAGYITPFSTTAPVPSAPETSNSGGLYSVRCWHGHYDDHLP
jgi:hypothetical protein